MSTEEKSVWIEGVVAIVAYGTYLSIIFGMASGPITEVAYVWPMVWSIGGAIVANIVLNILAAAVWPREAGKKDARDKQIARFGFNVGSAFLIAGALAAMIMAMLQGDTFWIANVIYLGFVLSAILSTTAKVFAYRGGFQPW